MSSCAPLDLRRLLSHLHAPLEKYGIKIHHDDVSAAWDRMVKKFYHHKVAQFFAVAGR